MFGDLSHLVLQQYWWIIISLLGALLVFLLFVQGGQTLIYRLGKTDEQRTILVNVLGHKWEFTFTTLVTFGGAFFAAFPLFYSTSFGGAYWVWMIILFAFVLQAVSYEFRTKKGNFLGKRTFETFLFVNGLLATVLLGVAVSTFFTGSMFSVDSNNFSGWELPTHGLEAALDIQNISLGLSVFFLSRILATLFFLQNIDHEEIVARSRRQLVNDVVPFLFFFILFAILLLSADGFAVNPETAEIYLSTYKYFNNLVEMPFVGLLFVVGVFGVLAGIYSALFRFEKSGGIAVWYTGIGTVLTVFSLFLIAGLNNTAYYPSVFDMQHSLTIANSSSSHYTLTAMSYVSLLVPFVVTYIFLVWRTLTKTKVDKKALDAESHVY